MADFPTNLFWELSAVSLEQLVKQEPIDVTAMVPAASSSLGGATHVGGQQWGAPPSMDTADPDLNDLLRSLGGDFDSPSRGHAHSQHQQPALPLPLPLPDPAPLASLAPPPAVAPCLEEADAMLDDIINHFPLGNGIEMVVQQQQQHGGSSSATPVQDNAFYCPVQQESAGLVTAKHQAAAHNITPAQASSSLYQHLTQPSFSSPSSSSSSSSSSSYIYSTLPEAVSSVTSHEGLDRLMSMMQRQSEALHSTNTNFSSLQDSACAQPSTRLRGLLGHVTAHTTTATEGAVSGQAHVAANTTATGGISQPVSAINPNVEHTSCKVLAKSHTENDSRKVPLANSLVEYASKEVPPPNLHMEQALQKVPHANPHTEKVVHTLPHTNPHMEQVMQKLPHTNSHTEQVMQKLPHTNPHIEQVTQKLPHTNPHMEQVTQKLPHTNPHMEQIAQKLPHVEQVTQRLPHTNPHLEKVTQKLSRINPHMTSAQQKNQLAIAQAEQTQRKLPRAKLHKEKSVQKVLLANAHREHASRKVPLIDPHTEHPNSEHAPHAGPGSSNPFQIDTSLLASVPRAEQAAELQNLGLTVYNKDDIEQGIMAQVTDAIENEEKERLTKILEKQLKAVSDEIRTVRQELSNTSKVEKLIGSSPSNQEAKKKLDTVRRHKQNKVKQLKKLKAKQLLLTMKLTGDTEGIDSNDEQLLAGDGEVALTEALGLGSKAKETETERMIRQGEMTPFGTTVAGDKASGPRLSRSGEMTSFEKYLMDQQQKVSSKKKQTNLKRSHSSERKPTNEKPNSSEKSTRASKKGVSMAKGTTGVNAAKGAPSGGAVLKKPKSAKCHSVPASGHAPTLANGCGSDSSESMPGLDASSQPNLFDAKDKRQYRSSEQDFSGQRSSRAKFPRLRHNFSGDGQLSDHEEHCDDDDINDHDTDYVPSDDLLMEAEEDQEEEESDYLSGTEHAHIKQKTLNKKKRSPKKVPANGDSSGEEGTTAKKKRNRKLADQDEVPSKRHRDDGDYDYYIARLRQRKKERLKRKQQRAEADETDSSDSDCEQVDPSDGFKVPNKVWNNLYPYQKTCVRWLYELHGQQAGGIVGDEMGLGKTVQIIAFLVGLRVSRLADTGASTRYMGLGPTLVVCPATVMHQWVREFHKWWPPFRVAVLHSSGSFTSSVIQLIDDIAAAHGVLVTSYGGLTIHQDALLDYDWHYVVLDEGHKIRNPNAQVTVAAKRFRTCHRLILSGSPVQNNLKELWSLFDFIFPGKLGTLPDFMAHFSVPIVQGGYSTATQVQVQTAYKCACVLRDTINPYLLRRMKSDVRHNLSLPDKNEQVLFCRLTDDQRDVYTEYLHSKECAMILKGDFMVFPGLITLRKVCNHPDLSTGGPQAFESAYHHYPDGERDFGHWKRSGKMFVVRSLLQLWRKQGHRVLLFTQSKQMLVILESFVTKKGYSYLKMDGGTSISARQPLINKFNEDESYFVFLLTTRVGGLGINLTGANRIIIYDPDWNPSTDMQAQERAWRIGQTKPVTIYRLLTAGTIEEKIYHRQIFKQFLTNRVLKDPKQRRLFKANDMHELFTLTEVDQDGTTETSAIFSGTGSDVKIDKKLVQLGQAEAAKGSARRQNRFDVLLEQRVKEKAEEAGEMDPDEEMLIGDNIAPAKANSKESGIGKRKDKDKAKAIAVVPSNISNTAVAESSGTLEVKVEIAGAGAAEDKHDSSGTEMKNKAKDESLQKMKELAKRLSQQFGREKSDGGATVEKVVTNGHLAEKKGSKEKTHHQKHKKSKHKDKRSDKDGAKDRHRHSKKHKKKKKKDIVVEGERIAHLSKSEAYVQPEKNEAVNANSADQDSYVLAKLLNKSGVHSALQHDKIMMSSDPDYALVEGEAERVAKESARALRRSRQQCPKARSGIPTWTGQTGTAAQPKPRFGMKKNSKLLPAATATESSPSKPTQEKKPEVAPPTGASRHFDGTLAGSVETDTGAAAGAMTSSQLLDRMKSRNMLSLAENGVGTAANSSIGVSNIELITDIRNYIAFQSNINGQASTGEIIDFFKTRVTKGHSATFKSMLNQVCDLIKRDGVGMWYLKPEYM